MNHGCLQRRKHWKVGRAGRKRGQARTEVRCHQAIANSHTAFVPTPCSWRVLTRHTACCPLR